MSPREKRLLAFLAIAGFLVLNFVGFKMLTDYRAKIQLARTKAESELKLADQFLASQEKVQEEMDWLAEHEPKPVAKQDALTNLQQLVEREARTRGLVIKQQKMLASDETGFYHRAKVEFSVSGTEQALYAWIDRLQIPTEFRAVTSMVLLPNKEDDTKIDARLIIEQWFIPQSNES